MKNDSWRLILFEVQPTSDNLFSFTFNRLESVIDVLSYRKKRTAYTGDITFTTHDQSHHHVCSSTTVQPGSSVCIRLSFPSVNQLTCLFSSPSHLKLTSVSHTFTFRLYMGQHGLNLLCHLTNQYIQILRQISVSTIPHKFIKLEYQPGVMERESDRDQGRV